MGASDTSEHRTRRRVLVGVALLLAGVVVGSGTAAAHGAKTYKVSVDAEAASPAVDLSAPAGASRSMVLTLSNTATSQRLGSANIQVAADVVVGGTPTISQGSVALVAGPAPYLALRNLSLAPGRSLQVRFGTTVRCVAGPKAQAWPSSAKQANDYNGFGNDFVYDPRAPRPSTTITGTCSLRFDGQPADAERLATISTSSFQPAGPPVRVGIYDGAGVDAVAWWSRPIVLGFVPPDPDAAGAHLQGTTSVVPTGGSASFAPNLDISASGYRLTATTSPLLADGTMVAGATSSEFTVVDDATACIQGRACSVSASQGNTRARVDVDTGRVVGTAVIAELQVSIDSATAPAFECSIPSISRSVEFEVDELVPGSTGLKTVSITLPASVATKPLDQYRVCFASRTVFITRDKVPAPFVGGVYVGLLPDCSKKNPAAPCARPTTCDPWTKSVTVSFLAPKGDPWGKVA